MSKAQEINEPRLETDLTYRFTYLTEFMGFHATDIQRIHDAAGWLAPLVPGLVDAVYEKLFQYQCTKRHFLPKQAGYDGQLPQNIDEITHDHPQIQFRKKHLGQYLASLVTRPYDTKMVEYLDMVGRIHTPGAGNQQINVPLVQMNALMGFVSDALTATILGAGLAREIEVSTLRAFQKLLWLQNDLIVRHYAK
jgi:hypothetical protein